MFRKKEQKSGMLAMSVIGGIVGGVAAMYLMPQLERQIGRMTHDVSGDSQSASSTNMMTEMGKEMMPAITDGANMSDGTFQEMIDTFIEQE